MKEIEIKAKVEDLSSIKEKLRALGCEFSEPIIQRDISFIHKSLEIPDITRGTISMRIRDTNGNYILTMKKQMENSLDNIEIEINVSDPKKTEDILKILDYHEVARINKKRITCKYKDMEICLDDVDKLGTFVEVEKMSDGDSLKIQKDISEFLNSLGVSGLIIKGYDRLIYEHDMNDKSR